MDKIDYAIFLKYPVITILPGGTCISHKEIDVRVSFRTKNKEFTIPEDYRCDAASVPPYFAFIRQQI